MPDSDSRRSVAKTRRDGRRSLAAYDSCSRGEPARARHIAKHGERVEPSPPRGATHGERAYVTTLAAAPRSGVADAMDAGAWCAGVAFALVFPLLGAPGP